MSSSSRPARKARPSTSRVSVKALVAVGSSPEGRTTLTGELVWFPLPCGRTACTCTCDFSGVVTRGITDVAQVRTFTDTTRTEMRRAITAGMCRDCVPDALAPSQAERLLRAAERLADGTLVRRDAVGSILPFPAGSTISSDGHVTAPIRGADR